MKPSWLLLDVNYLAHRAMHSTGGLKWAGQATGVTYGIFRDVLQMQEQFGAAHVVFCFDHGYGIRKQMLKEYKSDRAAKKRSMSEDQLLAYKLLEKEIVGLKESILPYLGYENVLYQDGYEADDMIAMWCKVNRDEGNVIVVTADKDMLQILDRDVCLYNPTSKKVTTQQSFYDEWKLNPKEWAAVKAVAGCSTDQVPGVPGVGEKTAAIYFRGEMADKHAKAHKAIDDWIESGNFDKSLKLVKLPLDGCKAVKAVKDKVDLARWKKLCDKLSMKSIRDKVPGHGFGIGTMSVKRSPK
jgi:DNA polymerase I